jgi:hypothetical protein
MIALLSRKLSGSFQHRTRGSTDVNLKQVQVDARFFLYVLLLRHAEFISA